MGYHCALACNCGCTGNNCGTVQNNPQVTKEKLFCEVPKEWLLVISNKEQNLKSNNNCSLGCNKGGVE